MESPSPPVAARFWSHKLFVWFMFFKPETMVFTKSLPWNILQFREFFRGFKGRPDLMRPAHGAGWKKQHSTWFNHGSGVNLRVETCRILMFPGLWCVPTPRQYIKKTIGVCIYYIILLNAVPTKIIYQHYKGFYGRSNRSKLKISRWHVTQCVFSFTFWIYGMNDMVHFWDLQQTPL